jgi:AcrR family transcriptional regulator
VTVPDSISSSAPGLRERNKAKRRGGILDSALELLRSLPLAEVSVERIAAQAGVAPATVYNLIGSKEGLLLACVERVVDGLVEGLVAIDPTVDPIAAAIGVVEMSNEAFIADSHAFRQIIGAVTGFAGADARPRVDPAQLQIAAMQAAQQHGVLRDDIDAAALGRQVYVSYNGALTAWARHHLTDDGLRYATRHGLWTALAAAATDTHRPEFLARLSSTGREMTAAGWGDG